MTKRYRSGRTAVAGAVTLSVATALWPLTGVEPALAAPPDWSQAGGKVHQVEARVKPILRIGQLQFRDLNGNGQLDAVALIAKG